MHVELAGEHPLGLGASEVSIDGIELNAQLATDGAADSGRLEKARRQFSLVGAQLAQFRDRSPHDLERLDLKQDVLAAIDAVLPTDRIIASSTSSYPPSDLQAKCKHPERVVVGHPFNPPHLIPLVEVVGGRKTDPAAVDWSMKFYDGIGKKAILLKKEIVGHYVNRVQEAIFREMVHCVAEGIVSVEDADIGVAYGPGLRWAFMGPFETIELNAPGGIPDYCSRYAASLDRMVKSSEGHGNPFEAATVTEVMREWRGAQSPDRVKRLSDWRDGRLAALRAHKRAAARKPD